MSMTAVDLFPSPTIQKIVILRKIQIEAGTLHPYSGGKSVAQLRINKRIKTQSSIFSSRAHLFLNTNGDGNIPKK